MDILFCGSFFPDNRVEEIWQDSKGPMVISANTFQQALIEGWNLNGYDNISLFTLPCIGSFPKRYKRIWFKKSFFNFNSKACLCGSFLNLTGFKGISIFYSVKKNLKAWVKKGEENKTIIVYGMIPSYLRAAVAVKKLFPKIKLCVIVLDLPEYFDENKSLLSKVYSYMNTRLSYACNKYIDSYVILTKYMKDALNIGVKKWMLLEGIYLQDKKRSEKVDKECSHVILYTGKFDSRFGLTNLLDAFKSIQGQNYELWLCGEGDLKDYIIECAKKDNRIKYLGLLKRDEVLFLQKRATVLVNPRQANEEYTKYSFPSKTMEYMASGTPTIMYKLPGVPDDYLEYLVLVKDDTVETLRNTIIEWCEKAPSDLHEFGRKASEFILNNKNSRVQAKRVIDFVKSA